MPPGKQSQSNAMLYTVITFVGLFIIATTCAVIFYVKAEDYITQIATNEAVLNKIATSTERNSLSKIVGTARPGKSMIKTMEEFLGEMVGAVTGESGADVPASVKINEANIKINKTVEGLFNDGLISSKENVNLIGLVEQLKAQLDRATAGNRQLDQRYQKLQDDFDAADRESRFKEMQLIDEKNRFQALADEVQAKFDELNRIMDKSTTEQVQFYKDKLEKADARLKERSLELLTTQEELAAAQKDLAEAVAKLESLKKPFAAEVAAYRPDARIVSIDSKNKVVYLDIGNKDHVYRGLTFSVYDRNLPIPEDGKGKAEIEIFKIEENVSAAKINYSSRMNPVTPADIVANLIWDSKTSNRFIVAGNFDIDGNGVIDSDGLDKIVRLVRRWGGRIVDEVTIETDFVVLGTRPSSLPMPTTEQIEIDPTVQQKYEASLESGRRYDKIRSRAQALSVPVINQQKFLHLTGYQSLASKSTPF
ncbi:MAG: hypothetical protein DRP66_02300 [Planctomycetota bacterium]|nr:MAG: hypothetical protein DRP66_02300 [Planctomycetota bacterium]